MKFIKNAWKSNWELLDEQDLKPLVCRDMKPRIIREFLPKITRCFYISVNDQEQNRLFYELWIESWIESQMKIMEFISPKVYNEQRRFDLPKWTPELPEGWAVSTEVKSLSLAVVDFNVFEEFNNIKFRNVSYIRFVLDCLRIIKLDLETINLSRGFVLNENIFSEEFYPHVCKAAEKVLTMSEWEKMSDISKAKCYKWICNMLILQIYTISNNCLSRLDFLSSLTSRSETADFGIKLVLFDLRINFQVITSWAYNLLDNSIKQHLLCTNPTITAEVISGFDTEYVSKDYGKNKLLSCQISTSGNLKLFVPINPEFIFEGVNTLTSETYIKGAPKFPQIENFRKWINDRIAENRGLKFGRHDVVMNKIINYLANSIDRNIINVKRTPKGCNFQFAKIPIINKFIIPESGEELKIDFETLINIIHSNISLDPTLLKIINKIRDYDYTNTDGILAEFEDKISTPWDGKSLVEEQVITLVLSNEANKNIAKINRKGSGYRKAKAEIEGVNFNFNIIQNSYLCAHYNSADLTMLNNWKEVCNLNIDIIKKSFCSLLKPMIINGFKIYVRDTVLLASAAAGKLEAVGKMHKMSKVALSKFEIENMDVLFELNYEKFKEYAMQDSLITLIHALFMNDFSFGLGANNFPITLGSLATKYLKNQWRADGYRGYQLDANYPLGNSQVSMTPRGVTSLGEAGETLGYFMGSFRGGRNECFTYGVDKSIRWYDYDLTSCYSTVMSMLAEIKYENSFPLNPLVQENSCCPAEIITSSNNIKERKEQESTINVGSKKINDGVTIKDFMSIKSQPELEQEELSKLSSAVMAICGTPDYNKISTINPQTDLSKLDLLQSYSAIRVEFKFPYNVKYPPLPVNLNKNLTIYPLEGEGIITGLEFLSASNILKKALVELSETHKDLEKLEKQYYIKISAGVYIPFGPQKVFFNVINDLQANRRAHPKKSALERIYKDLGNMLYGKTVAGLGNNKKFDARTRLMKSMTGGDLSNPIIGTWITGFVRSLLAELLYNVQILGGNICSVTTDGFVTDIENLEEKILNNPALNKVFLLEYRKIRKVLSNDSTALEIKTNVFGLIQWTTRGQLSVDHKSKELNNYKVPIAAMTGFQKYYNSQDENIKMVTSAMHNGNKILFLQKTLSGALDTYKPLMINPQVSMLNSQRTFRTVFDTKRIITDKFTDQMFDSAPYLNINQARLNLGLMNEFRHKVYSEKFTTNVLYTSANSKQELMKFFVNICVSYFGFWSMKINEKQQLFELISEVFETKDKNFIFKIISMTQCNPANIISKLTPTVINKELISKLFYTIKTNKTIFNNPLFVEYFKRRFENFKLPSFALIIKPATNLILPEIEERIILTEREILLKEINRLLSTDINLNTLLLVKDMLKTSSSPSPAPWGPPVTLGPPITDFVLVTEKPEDIYLDAEDILIKKDIDLD